MSSSNPQDKTLELGVYKRPNRGLDVADGIAIALTVVWLIGVAVYFVAMPGDEDTTLPFVPSMMAAILPIALIWIGAAVSKTARVVREEAARLQATIDAMRQAYVNQAQSAGMGIKPAVERKLDEIAASQRETQAAVATFATSRSAALPSGTDQPALVQPGLPVGDSQPALALGTPPEAMAAPLSVDDFIGALNFPEDENDAVGFGQLRRALADRESGRLVRASQDVLTLLSQDGIYMDDLTPDRAKPSLWRKFADGERGASIAGLGGIRDRAALALAAGRMRSDPVFRDAVHHFLRQFDRTLVIYVQSASDEDIVRLSGTRSSRAFMLLGRVTGTFD